MGSAYVLAAVLVLGVLGAVGAGIKGYNLGRQSREAEVVELRASAIAAEKLVQAERTRLDAVAKAAALKYRKELEAIRKEAENRPQLIEVIRDEAACDLPPSFRMLHDTAAGYSAPASPAEPVSAASAATTIAINYEACRSNAARQQALIDIVEAANAQTLQETPQTEKVTNKLSTD